MGLLQNVMKLLGRYIFIVATVLKIGITHSYSVPTIKNMLYRYITIQNSYFIFHNKISPWMKICTISFSNNITYLITTLIVRIIK